MPLARIVTGVTFFGLCAISPSLAVAQTNDTPALHQSTPREGSGHDLTLHELIEAARDHHPSLKKQPLLSRSAELERSRLNTTYYPHLSLGGQATWQSEVTKVDIPVPGVAVTPPPKDQYRVTLDLQQTIWDGGVMSDQKQVVDKSTNVERERANVEWHQVRENVLSLYFNGVVQQELVAQADALDSYLDTLIEKTKLLVEQGLATQRDLLLLQAQQLEAEQVRIDASQALAGVRESLRDLTGQSIGSQAAFAPPPRKCSAKTRERPTVETVRRPELALLDAQGDLLQAQEELKRAGDRPRLDAFATGGYGRPGLNFLRSNFDFYFIGGVQLTVPLTYLYAGTHRTGDKHVEVQRSLLSRDREAMMTKLNVDYNDQSAELVRLENAAELDTKILVVREAARKQTELQIDHGTSSTQDLVDDLRKETVARTREAVHRAQRSLACHRLALIKGEL